MGFFSTEMSNMLQYFSFPLEVVGLTLAAIEVRFPETARRVSVYILSMVQRAANQYSQSLWEDEESLKFAKRKRIHLSENEQWHQLFIPPTEL